MRLLKHNGEGNFFTISPAASFLPGISKLQYIINDTAVWKMAISFKLVLESLTNSIDVFQWVVFYSDASNPRSITKEKHEKRNCLFLHDCFVCLVKLHELTFKYKKNLSILKCLKKSHAWP